MTYISKSLSVFAAAVCFVCAAVPTAIAQSTLGMAYDQLGRLTQATYPGGVVINFAYDAAGNRSSYVVTGSPNSTPPAPTPVGQQKIVPLDGPQVKPATEPATP